MLGGLALGAFPLAPGHAEDAKVEDVIVSGSGADNPNRLTRDETRLLLNTPRSAGVVSGEKAQEEHLERLSDFTQLVPNYQPNIGNPRTSKPAIRGLGAGAGTGDGSESDTGFIVDNVFYKHIGFQWADFVDLQSFELLLGPAGVTGGKNTTVGDVIIKTQLPSFERKATVETTFANYSHIIEKLNVTGPIIDDKLAYRVAFYLDKGDGWINDAVTGAGLLNNNRWGARGQLLYTGDEITDRLIFNYGTSHETNNSTSGIFGNSFLMYANGTMAATYAADAQKRLGLPLLSIDPYTQTFDRTGTLDERQQGVSNELNCLIGQNTLTSISAFASYMLHPRNSQAAAKKPQLSTATSTPTPINIRRSFVSPPRRIKSSNGWAEFSCFTMTSCPITSSSTGRNPRNGTPPAGRPRHCSIPCCSMASIIINPASKGTSPLPDMVRRHITLTRS